MVNYLVKTDRESQQTRLYEFSNGQYTLVASIYSDFDLTRTKKKIKKEEIVDSNLNPIAQIEVFSRKNLIEVTRSFNDLSVLSKERKYSEKSKEISFKKHSLNELSDSKFDSLRKEGLLELYTFPQISQLQQIAYFENGLDIAGLIQGRDNTSNLETLLVGLPFVIARRVELQEYIYALR